MSAQENTRLVQQAYRNIQSGDMKSFLNSLSENIEWQIPEMEHVPFAGNWLGREGVGRFFSVLAEAQDVVEFEPEEFVAQGDTVVVLGHFVMRIKATGAESSSPWAHVWTIADGRVARFREYVDTAAVSKAYSAARVPAKMR